VNGHERHLVRRNIERGAALRALVSSIPQLHSSTVSLY
jgi:hypothetical protein